MAFQSWITSSLVRHYPSTPAPRDALSHVPSTLEIARGERCSFQLAVRHEGDDIRPIQVTASGPPGWAVRVRRVGYVPVRHHNLPLDQVSLEIDGRGHIPGYVPDPLYDEDSLMLPPNETHAFWTSAQPGAEV
ncbi:MAG: hypothetical protein JXA74_14435, partial [Anaerolineae bacterium]|nr:hypothetical protein [Anaerolineae bacterium]